MNCIIIEDEHRASSHLESQLALTGYNVNVLDKIDSVEDAVAWLKDNQADIIFLDIQLGDGLSFEIFDHVKIKTPVIFTTSYDQYLTKAFDINSISYLLKPIQADSLRTALDKYSFLYEEQQEDFDIEKRINTISETYQKRFFVNNGNSLTSVPVSNIAYFRIQSGRHVILVTRDDQKYVIENTLDRLEFKLDPELFFRINRQFIIHIDAIKNMTNYDSIRIKVETQPSCKEDMVVSTKRIYQFKNWLNI